MAVMNSGARHIQRVYISLTLLNTLATSFIWGVNTLFLLDAGLSNAQAFAANAFYTAGMVLFEVPTGVVADSRGRRTSFLLGTITLSVSTGLYLLMWAYQAPFIGWALASLILGLGYTFFSGAIEAWLVDAMTFHDFKGNLEKVFAKGQIATGIAMLGGSVAGGVVAQFTNLGVPYVLRIVALLVAFAAGYAWMRDIGFTPERSKSARNEVRRILSASIDHGIKNKNIRWVMLASPFGMGIGVYVFYAMQPYLLKLYGDPEAYSIAGIVAAIVAGAQIVGGIMAPVFVRMFKRRTTILLLMTVANVALLFGFGFVNNFYVALPCIVGWALVFAASMPVRQTFINKAIPSKQRATVLSFDSMLSSIGGVVFQPSLGRVADAYSYSASYLVSGALSAVALPLVFLARRAKSPSDPIDRN